MKQLILFDLPQEDGGDYGRFWWWTVTYDEGGIFPDIDAKPAHLQRHDWWGIASWQTDKRERERKIRAALLDRGFTKEQLDELDWGMYNG